jgi:hypothetical protein
MVSVALVETYTDDQGNQDFGGTLPDPLGSPVSATVTFTVSEYTGTSTKQVYNRDDNTIVSDVDMTGLVENDTVTVPVSVWSGWTDGGEVAILVSGTGEQSYFKFDATLELTYAEATAVGQYRYRQPVFPPTFRHRQQV